MTSTSMKAFNGKTIVHRGTRANDRINIGGHEFILDTAFRKYWSTVQMAVVSTADREDLEPGDTVWIHHFVDDQDLPWGDNIGFVEYNQVYCRMRNKELTTLGNFVLVEPITNAELGMNISQNGLRLSMKKETDNAERIGIVRLPSPQAIKFGLKDGDKVLFNKNCEYEMLIDGKVYYRMELRDVIATVPDDAKIKV